MQLSLADEYEIAMQFIMISDTPCCTHRCLVAEALCLMSFQIKPKGTNGSQLIGFHSIITLSLNNCVNKYKTDHMRLYFVGTFPLLFKTPYTRSIYLDIHHVGICEDN